MKPTDQNRRAWDERHRRRGETMPGRPGMPDVVRERLPDVAGKHVLHLQCGTGEVTAELAEAGALVTGIDISPEALSLAQERAPNSAFVHGDVQALPVELGRGRFDLVYSVDAIPSWLDDVGGWARGIESALRTSGRLLLFDDHPVAACVDGFLHWRDDYFGELVSESGWPDVPLPGAPEGEATRARLWRLGQVVTAFAATGLVIREVDEFPAARPPHRQARVPAKFLLMADKPD